MFSSWLTPERLRLARNLLFAVGWIVAATLALYRGETPPAPPVFQTPADLTGYATGWTDSPDDVATVVATMEVPHFAATDAGQSRDALPDHAYLWDAHRKLTGSVPPPQNQNPVGSCVSFGTARAIERSLACQIAYQQQPFRFEFLSEEVIYAGSRHEIGGDRIRPTARDRYGDGSVGAWAAQFVTRYGAIPKGVYSRYDLTRYDPARCRQWGAVGAGVPDDLEPEVKNFTTGSAAQIRTWAEAKKSLAQGYSTAICSSVGFNKPGTASGFVDPAERDARGVCYQNGTWGHCMCLDGYHTDELGREWGHIENSWGEAHKGPVGWGSPNTSGFWTDSGTISRMLAQGDSWAFSAVKGFPARKPADWWSKAQPQRPQILREFEIALAW